MLGMECSATKPDLQLNIPHSHTFGIVTRELWIYTGLEIAIYAANEYVEAIRTVVALHVDLLKFSSGMKAGVMKPIMVPLMHKPTIPRSPIP